MWKNHLLGWRWVKTAVGLSACGVSLAAGCGSDQLRAVVAGIEAAAGTLEQANRDREDDITFGEWFLSELDD